MLSWPMGVRGQRGSSNTVAYCTEVGLAVGGGE